MLISIACAQCVDAAYCYRCSVVCVSVGLLVTAISPADAQCVDAAYCYTCSVACVFVCLLVTTMSPADAQCVDAAYCYRCSVVCVSVGLLVTTMSPADAQCVDAAYCYRCSVACVSVCRSQPWALLKRTNRSRCRLQCGLGWPQWNYCHGGLGPLGERAIWEDNLAAHSRV